MPARLSVNPSPNESFVSLLLNTHYVMQLQLPVSGTSVVPSTSFSPTASISTESSDFGISLTPRKVTVNYFVIVFIIISITKTHVQTLFQYQNFVPTQKKT